MRINFEEKLRWIVLMFVWSRMHHSLSVPKQAIKDKSKQKSFCLEVKKGFYLFVSHRSKITKI